MTGRMVEILRRYGQKTMIIPKGPGEVRVVNAFLQPVLKIREDPPAAVTPLGTVSERRWLYIGPAGAALSPGDRVRSEGVYLVVQEAVDVKLGQDKLYRRAILRREKEGPL